MMSIISFDVSAKPAVDHSLDSMMQSIMVGVTCLLLAPIAILAATFIVVSPPLLIQDVGGWP